LQRRDIRSEGGRATYTLGAIASAARISMAAAWMSLATASHRRMLLGGVPPMRTVLSRAEEPWQRLMSLMR
jgi:hypothetical protein